MRVSYDIALPMDARELKSVWGLTVDEMGLPDPNGKSCYTDLRGKIVHVEEVDSEKGTAAVRYENSMFVVGSQLAVPRCE